MSVENLWKEVANEYVEDRLDNSTTVKDKGYFSPIESEEELEDSIKLEKRVNLESVTKDTIESELEVGLDSDTIGDAIKSNNTLEKSEAENDNANLLYEEVLQLKAKNESLVNMNSDLLHDKDGLKKYNEYLFTENVVVKNDNSGLKRQNDILLSQNGELETNNATLRFFLTTTLMGFGFSLYCNTRN